MRWWVRPRARLVSCTCSDGRPPTSPPGVVAPTIHGRLMPAGDAKMRPVAVRLYAAVSIVCVMEEEEVGGIVAAGGRQTRPLADPSRQQGRRGEDCGGDTGAGEDLYPEVGLVAKTQQ